MKNYYPFINQAEEHIIQGDFDNALKAYKKGFDNVSEVQSKDLFNATICAIKTQEEKLTLDYLTILFRRGMQLSKIVRTTTIEEADTELRQSIEDSFNKINKSKTYSYNQEARSLFQELAHLDQVFRIQGDYQNIEYLRKKVDSTDHVILQRFLDFVQQNGFPSDAMIGIDNYPNRPIYSIILHHYYQGMSTNPNHDNFSSILKKAVKIGDIDPCNAFGFMSFMQKDVESFFGFPLFMQYSGDSELRYFPMLRKDSIAISNNRKEWGLASIEISRKKEYLKKNDRQLQDFLLGCNYCVMKFSTGNSSFLQELKNETTLYSPDN